MKRWIQETNARWIWPAALGCGINQYVEYRHEFKLGALCFDAELVISADTNYAVWLNGMFLDCGQYSDVPPHRTYDCLPAGRALRVGRNTLTVGVYYQGVTSFQYLKGEPGVIYGLHAGAVCIVSGTATKWRPSPAYRSGLLPRITPQLGFTFEHDARPETTWTRITKADLREEAASIPIRPRPLRKLTMGARISSVIVAQGVLRRSGAGKGTVAQGMQREFLSAQLPADLFASPISLELPSADGLTVRAEQVRGNGVYVVLDLGREEAGFLDLEVDTDAGATIDVAHGEHLDDLRVRACVGGRNFANRYVCRTGRQTFTHFFQRIAGRYLQLHVRHTRTHFHLYYAGMRPVAYPARIRGSFVASDSLLDNVYSTGVRTLQLCMHEHYEDCPWREQALYANDSRNQALSGYYAFGDARFPAVSLALLGSGLKPDGWLEMCMPSEIAITIPSFTLMWILALADHWQYTADRAFVRRMLPAVRAILSAQAARMQHGLLPCPTGPRYWPFYDWADGLDGWIVRLKEGETRLDALLNMLLAMACRTASTLAAAVGARTDANHWSALAANLLPAIHAAFWDAKENAYLTYKGDRSIRHFAELTQALAILSGAAGQEPIRASLRKRLVRGVSGWTGTTLSQSLYKYEALLTGLPADGAAALGAMNTEWGRMLRRGATSFWETRRGSDDFGGAGSLCHGWSAIPVYFYGAYVLGIRPVAPGFREFVVDPLPGLTLAARGDVPTPHGIIRVEWQCRGGRLRGIVETPKACRCISPSGQFDICTTPRRRRKERE